MTLKTKGVLIGIFCLLTGAFWLYFQGYKDNGIAKTFSIVLIYVSWNIILLSLFGQWLLKDKKISFKQNKAAWVKTNLIKAAIYLSYGVCLVGTMELTNNFGAKRVTDTLENKPTKNTIGIITKIDSRNTRGGAKLWAIIEYRTKTMKVQQAVYDYNEKYTVGQKYVVRYSIDNPEMFEIIKRQE